LARSSFLKFASARERTALDRASSDLVGNVGSFPVKPRI